MILHFIHLELTIPDLHSKLNNKVGIYMLPDYIKLSCFTKYITLKKLWNLA